MCTDSHSSAAANDTIAASQCRCTSARMSSGTLESTIKLRWCPHLSNSSKCSLSVGKPAVQTTSIRPGVPILPTHASTAAVAEVCVFIIISCVANLLQKRSD